MSAIVGYGIHGILPYDSIREEIFAALQYFSRLGHSSRFVEVIDGEVFVVENRRGRGTVEPYGGPDAAAIVEDARGGGYISYTDWVVAFDGVDLLVPNAPSESDRRYFAEWASVGSTEEEEAGEWLASLEEHDGIITIEEGIEKMEEALAESDPDSEYREVYELFRDTLLIAARRGFIVTISG